MLFRSNGGGVLVDIGADEPEEPDGFDDEQEPEAPDDFEDTEEGLVEEIERDMQMTLDEEE